ncbi:MAG: hypothetical protein JW714_01205 [Candidatus Omnitrophica bacterium]|nr:hypothetical protein [Candidatus Omnitrophota bacterium]
MKTKGLSLIELLVAAFIASFAIGATMICFSHVYYLSDLAKDTTVAVSDIRDMMEKIWSTPFEFIASNFPNGDADGPTDTEYNTIVGGYNLNNEHLRVDYTNPVADPLEIMITCTWTDLRGRAQTMQLATFRTR